MARRRPVSRVARRSARRVALCCARHSPRRGRLRIAGDVRTGGGVCRDTGVRAASRLTVFVVRCRNVRRRLVRLSDVVHGARVRRRAGVGSSLDHGELLQACATHRAIPFVRRVRSRGEQPTRGPEAECERDHEPQSAASSRWRVCIQGLFCRRELRRSDVTGQHRRQFTDGLFLGDPLITRDRRRSGPDGLCTNRGGDVV